MRALKACWKSVGQLERIGAASLGAALFGLSCAPSVRDAGPPAALIAASRVQNQSLPDRPRLTLVEREGDPERGVALAVRVGIEPQAAPALGALVEERMRVAGFAAIASVASPSGFIVSALVERPEDASRFLRAGNAALSMAPSAEEAARAAARVRNLPVRVAGSPSEAALARCSGELVFERELGRAAVDAARLAEWLRKVTSGDVAFAVVGAKEHLAGAQEALGGIPPWTRLRPTAAPSKGGDEFGAVASAGDLSLSVALSGVPAGRAIAAAERLGDPDSLLAVRLGASFPAWQVVRVATNLDRGGACLRIDLQSNGSSPSLDAVARSAAHTLSEIQETLDSIEPSSWVLAKQVLAMEGPHQAAAVAAWQSLYTSSGEEREQRRIVHFAGELARATTASELAELMSRHIEAPVPELERRSGVEPGQGKFWMLLATPCGTSAEDSTTAGTLALALHASALAFNGRSGVTLEPWFSPDAMGLFAHTTAITPGESPKAQAERVAEALARALLSSGPPPEVIVQSREALMAGLSDGPSPTLALALRQTSGNHPSWLEPRGTWASLSAISARSVQLERESFLRGKLRIATLGNQDEAQVQDGERRLFGLLASADAGRGECPARPAASSAPGRYRLEASGGANSAAVLSVALPPGEGGLSPEVQWTEILMNREDGWLDRALHHPGLVSTARARVLGGGAAAALVIEIHALDGKRDDAVAQLRGLFGRLRAGAATAEDVRRAQDLLSRRESQRQLNPRWRLIDLWQGRRQATATLESLRALHRAAFEPGREVVVLAEPAP